MTGTTPPPLGSRPLSQVRTEVVVGRPAVADDIVTRLRNPVSYTHLTLPTNREV